MNVFSPGKLVNLDGKPWVDSSGKLNSGNFHKIMGDWYVASGGAAAPAFDPATLFGVSDRGGIYDLTSTANLFQLSGGTTPVTAIGEPIGYIADAGPIGRPALQATTTARPIWSGWPRTFASTSVTNGRFAADTDWTKGTGWTITGGRAVKAAGTASVLSQAISLTAGKSYFVQFQMTRTAGTVLARLTGGTTVSGRSRNINGGYYDVLLSVTGNTTLEFSADAAFNGEVFNVVVREVLTWVNESAYFDGTNDRLRTAAIDLSNSNKATMVVSFRSSQLTTNKIIAQFGGTGQVRLMAAELVSGRHATFQDGTNSIFSLANDDVPRSADGALLIEVDSDGATAADQVGVWTRGFAATETNTASPAMVTVGAMAANGVLSMGSPFNNNTWFQGHISKLLLCNRIFSDSEKVAALNWAKIDKVYAGILGDSTVTSNNATHPLPNAYSIGHLVGGLISGNADVSKVGDRIAGQLTLWNAVVGKSALECVIIQIGLNDVKGRVGNEGASIAQVITDYQSLVSSVRASVSASCKIYVSGITPCKVWLDAATNPTAAYNAWLALNEAIAGNGATPITGVDGRITSHVAALNDGSGNLATIYETQGDGVHENSEARFIIAQAWRTALEADGLL